MQLSNYANLDSGAQRWLNKHKSKLPSMDDGANGCLRYVGLTADLNNGLESCAPNPRKGSDVYVRGWFEIRTVHSKLSSIPDAPTMPIKQWIHQIPPKRNANRAA